MLAIYSVVPRLPGEADANTTSAEAAAWEACCHVHRGSKNVDVFPQTGPKAVKPVKDPKEDIGRPQGLFLSALDTFGIIWRLKKCGFWVWFLGGSTGFQYLDPESWLPPDATRL